MSALLHPTSAGGEARADAALGCLDVVVRFGTTTILDGVSLDLYAGEVTALVGPNGAGKSTLLAVLAGDLAPTTGSVHVSDREVARWRLADLARERAVLPQEHRVAFGFAVADVVRMGRAPWRARPEEDLDEVEVAAAMSTTAITRLTERPFSALSGGEKGRTSFARVLAQQTPILLLDEPTAALDVGHQEAVLASARERADDGCAIVVVLHDLSLAAAWSDRVVLLRDGRVACDGPPTAVFDPALLSEVYDHPIAVVAHPTSGELLVLPDRRGRLS